MSRSARNVSEEFSPAFERGLGSVDNNQPRIGDSYPTKHSGQGRVELSLEVEHGPRQIPQTEDDDCACPFTTEQIDSGKSKRRLSNVRLACDEESAAVLADGMELPCKTLELFFAS
jgi:hypothetical protein